VTGSLLSQLYLRQVCISRTNRGQHMEWSDGCTPICMLEFQMAGVR